MTDAERRALLRELDEYLGPPAVGEVKSWPSSRSWSTSTAYAAHLLRRAAAALREPDGEALVREFAAYYDDWFNERLAEGKPAPIAATAADRFLAARKEGT